MLSDAQLAAHSAAYRRYELVAQREKEIIRSEI